MAAKRQRVAILMHRWVGYLHGVQLGIAEYVAKRPEWICSHVRPDQAGLETLASMPLDGIVAYVEPEYVNLLKSRNVPVVDVSNWLQEANFVRVIPDDRVIGGIAAQYLADLGLQHFGYWAYAKTAFSHLRLEGFRETLARSGLKAQVWSDNPAIRDRDAPTSTLEWLRKLQKPVGIFCPNDTIATTILDQCREAKLRVPEEVCILGVDDDELLTQISHPPLSSIALHTQKIGFEAARLLDEMMANPGKPVSPVLFPPVGVVARQSTNLLAIADADVLAAVRYIRDHVHERLTVDDVLKAVPVNRRFLERRFKEHLGRTPLQEIRRVRIEKAKELLSGTDMSMPTVARRSGFPNPERLANVFHAMTGMTPTHYRREFRLHDF